MKKSLVAPLTVALLFAALAVASAEEKKPALTVSFAGYQQLLDRAKTLGTVSGRPNLDKMLDSLVVMATQGKGLPGLDKSRPWGLAVYAGEGGFPALAFVPVTDLKQLVESLPREEEKAPAADAQGVFELKLSGRPMFVRQKGDWAVAAESRDGLKDAPADPALLLADLSKKYLVAAKASIQNVPKAIREAALNQLRTLADMTMPSVESDLGSFIAGARKQNFKNLMKLSNELEEVVVGLAVDAGSGAIRLDTDVTALPGTDTAKRAARAKAAKTDFAGFRLPDAAITLLSVETLDDADVAQAKAALGSLRKSALKDLDGNEDLTTEQRKVAKLLLGDALDVAEATIDTKHTDVGLAVMLEEGAPTVVAGMAVAQGAKLDKLVRQFVGELTKEQPDLAQMIKLDAAAHKKVKFHMATVPIQDDDAAAILGKSIDVVLGIGEDSLYFGVGKNVLPTLKKVLDNSAEGVPVPSMQLIVTVTPVAKFIGQVAPIDEIKSPAAMLAQALSGSPGKDHVTVVSQAIPNGTGVRVTVEEGVVKGVMGLLPGAKAGGGAGPAVAWRGEDRDWGLDSEPCSFPIPNP